MSEDQPEISKLVAIADSININIGINMGVIKSCGFSHTRHRVHSIKTIHFFINIDIITLYKYNWSIKMLAIKLPHDIEERLDKLAQSTGRTKTYYAREAILEDLDDLEDLYLAEQRMHDIRIGKSETIALDKVMKKYGLEN